MQLSNSGLMRCTDVKSWLRKDICTDEFAFCSTLWWVWRDRNNSIFNPDDVWSTLQAASSLTSLLVDWIPPYGHIMTINCDASLFNDYPYAGFGCVIRDSNRVWIK
ncbi:hypothetical protein PIB30_033192, partial [Stylosanthes scabra]|nr:hypothetical protein [Stylosanthes scabra]